MDTEAHFDAARLGLETHYGPEMRRRIQRLMLEDWQKAGVKLPTYMKLVARSIAPAGVPEAWLGKLIHQTMDKMLKGTATPRYEFWACLHLYLIRKYGPEIVADPEPDEIAQLGQALVRFASFEEAETGCAGTFTLRRQPNVTLTLQPAEENGFFRIRARIAQPSTQTFGETVTQTKVGAGTRSAERIIGVLRDVASHKLSTVATAIADLEPAADQP